MFLAVGSIRHAYFKLIFLYDKKWTQNICHWSCFVVDPSGVGILHCSTQRLMTSILICPYDSWQPQCWVIKRTSAPHKMTLAPHSDRSCRLKMTVLSVAFWRVAFNWTRAELTQKAVCLFNKSLHFLHIPFIIVLFLLHLIGHFTFLPPLLYTFHCCTSSHPSLLSHIPLSSTEGHLVLFLDICLCNVLIRSLYSL